MKKFAIFTEFKGIDKISKPLSKMQNRVMKFTRSASRMTKKITEGAKKFGKVMAIGVGAGIAAATAALIAFKAQVEAVTGPADKLAKTARRLDFDIEAMQEWSFVAEQSGLSTEGLYKNLEGLSKRMGELKGGTGSLKTVLDKLNPTLLTQLKGAKDSAAGFELLMNAIGSETDVTKKAAIATAAFGRSGLQMINITHNSAEAIKNMREEMRQNGILTQKEAENAEAYNDAWNSFTKTLGGFRASVITPLLPELTKIVGTMREWVLNNKGLIFDKIEKGLAFIRDNWEPIKKWGKWVTIAVVAVGALTAAIIAIGTAITAVIAIIPGLVIALKVALVGAAMVAYYKIVQAFMLIREIIILNIKNAILGVKNIWLEFTLWLSGAVDTALSKIGELWEKIKGFGGGILETVINAIVPTAAPSVTNPVATPAQRTAELIEKRVTNSAEVTIRDESGRAEVTKGGDFPGFSFASSGGF